MLYYCTMDKATNVKLYKRKQFIDAETGEVFEAVIFGEPYWKADKGFVKIFALGLKELVKNDEIIGKAARLLFWILAEKLSWNSYEFYMTEKEVINALGISRATYYRWLEALIKANILEKIATNIYRLTPRLAIKGHTKKAEITIEGEKYEGIDF